MENKTDDDMRQIIENLHQENEDLNDDIYKLVEKNTKLENQNRRLKEKLSKAEKVIECAKLFFGMHETNEELVYSTCLIKDINSTKRQFDEALKEWEGE